jgi:hypothetical protein
LFDRPEAETEADESKWLYDSTRSYLDQKKAYDEAKGSGAKGRKGIALLEEFDVNCSSCGKKFRPKKRRRAGGPAYCSRYCCNKVNQAASRKRKKDQIDG